MPIPNSVKLLIYRYEKNDIIDPTYYIIGFKILCELNNSEAYVETTIDNADCIDKNENEICLLAYNKLKSIIILKSNELENKNFLIGSEFIPPIE